MLPNLTSADQLLGCIFQQRLLGDHRQTHSSTSMAEQPRTTSNTDRLYKLRLFFCRDLSVTEFLSLGRRHPLEGCLIFCHIETTSYGTFPLLHCSATTCIRTGQARTSAHGQQLCCKWYAFAREYIHRLWRTRLVVNWMSYSVSQNCNPNCVT